MMAESFSFSLEKQYLQEQEVAVAASVRCTNEKATLWKAWPRSLERLLRWSCGEELVDFLHSVSDDGRTKVPRF